MGALHLKQPRALPVNLQSYLDSARNGVVFMSLGSKIQFSDLPPKTLRVFMNVFASLPYDVLIKWNEGELPNKPANVKLEKWLPQNDMLHHPKIKVFLTHGGLQSADETIAARVPVISFPIFSDQFFYSQRYEQLGVGMKLDINTVTEDELRNAIVTVAEDKSYRENIDALAWIMKQQRAGGLEKAMFWIDYVAKYGGGQLRSPLSTVSLVDYLMLDALAFVASLVLLTLVGLIAVLRYLWKMFASKESTDKTNTKKKAN